MSWLECREHRTRIEISDISHLLIEPSYFGLIQLDTRNQLRRLETERACCCRIEFGPRIDNIILQVRSPPRKFEVIGNKNGAKQRDQTRTDDEVDVNPAGRTDAPIVRVDRPIVLLMKGDFRFHRMSCLGRPGRSRPDQDCREIDLDFSRNRMWLVGRHSTNLQH